MISRRLYTADLPEPDLLVRTSGDAREQLSALADRLRGALRHRYTLARFQSHRIASRYLDFQRRERRFGGISAEPQMDATPGGEQEMEEIAISSQ